MIFAVILFHNKVQGKFSNAESVFKHNPGTCELSFWMVTDICVFVFTANRKESAWLGKDESYTAPRNTATPETISQRKVLDLTRWSVEQRASSL